MYPSYKLQDVLDEYAVTFYSLLETGYRQRFAHYQMLAQIASVSIMKDEMRQEFMRQLEWASKEPSDILNIDDGADDGMEDVKQLFRKI